MASQPGAPRLDPQEDRLIRIDQVLEIAGCGRTMLYRMIKARRFPSPCKPGGVGSRWSLQEVREWRAEQLASRQAA